MRLEVIASNVSATETHWVGSPEWPAQQLELAKREREAIEQALADAGGNQSEAARQLGISRHTLIERIKKYGLARPRKKS